jgi:CHAT domain-containing protein
MRSNISRDDFRVSYFAGNRKIYELYVEILLQLGEATKTAVYVERALEASEKARARAFVELLNQSGANIKAGADARLLQMEREINSRLSAKAGRQTRLLSGGKASADELNIIAREISDLIGEREKLAAQIRRTNPTYAALTQPAPLKAAEIQGLLDKDTILLEYALGDRQSSLWLVANDSISAHKLPKREEIENVARRYYESLKTNGGAPDNQAGNALSEMLLKPVAERLAGKRVVVVGEGALQYISFAALPNPIAKNRFLIETNEIVNLPSAATLATLRRANTNRKPASKSVAVFADPVFSPDDPRVKNGQAVKTKSLVDEKLQRSVEEAAASNNSGEEVLKAIPRLPFSRREAETILAGLPANNALKAVDFAASAETATTENLSDYQIIHFATHGLLNSKNPELSGLVLSLVNEKGAPQNGFLRLNDIYNLRLNSALVVLSACQTALGKDIRGEGLIGLTRGFMYAGTPRVVASLWKVDDAATAELMKHFYQNMLQKKLRPAAALRAAQIEISRDERYKSPYYWAAFTIQGEWR